MEGPLSEEWRWPSLGAPNGVLDVCGTVTSVSLSQGAQPPDVPLSLTEDAAQEGGEEKGFESACPATASPRPWVAPTVLGAGAGALQAHDTILQQHSTPEPEAP